MASVAYFFETHVAAPRDAAFAWWTNFTLEDHEGDRHLRGTRVNLVRSGDEWTWTDEYVALGLRTRWTFRARTEAPKREEFHAVTALGELRGTIRFEARERRTLVVEEGVFRARGLGRLLLPFLKRRLVRLLETDFREHWAEFERESSSLRPTI